MTPTAEEPTGVDAHEAQDDASSDRAGADRPTPMRRLAIIGNVCVGKTSLFDRLCTAGEHPANVPGSTQTVARGVLSTGPNAAPRAFRRRCASCSAGRSSRHGAGAQTLCSGPGPALPDGSGCPALGTLPRSAVDAVTVTHLYDTPGSATLVANSEDEMAARDLLLSGQISGVILVADAKKLRRSLALTLEVAELGLPMVLALNMVDEAESLGVDTDDVRLAEILGVPVVRTVAVENRGLRRLASALADARPAARLLRFPAAVEASLAQLTEILANPVIAPRLLSMLLLCGDRGAETWVGEQLGKRQLAHAREVAERLQRELGNPLRQILADSVYAEAGRITDRVLSRRPRGPSPLLRLGRLAQRPLSGSLIALAVLALAYLWVGAFGATLVVDTLSTHLFDGFLVPLTHDLVAPLPWEFARDAITDPDFGLLPTGLFLAVGVVLPVLFCFYLLQAVLEDSGYLPRLAVLADRAFRRVGLNGQGLIPLILGFSCVAAAVITTRMLPTRKERIILTLLVVGLPCAPLLAVMVVILSKMPWTATAVVFAVLAARLLATGFITGRAMGGPRPDFILEIPPMRIPRLAVLVTKTWRRAWDFVREAVPVFLAASFAMFLFDRAGGLTVIEEAAQPLVHDILGLPHQAVQVFIKTAIRREAGATELNLLRDHFDNVQMVVTLLVMTLLLPCVNTAIVIIKERGLRVAAAVLVAAVLSSIAVGAAVNATCRALGVAFS